MEISCGRTASHVAEQEAAATEGAAKAEKAMGAVATVAGAKGGTGRAAGAAAVAVRVAEAEEEAAEATGRRRWVQASGLGYGGVLATLGGVLAALGGASAVAAVEDEGAAWRTISCGAATKAFALRHSSTTRRATTSLQPVTLSM